VGIAEGRIEGVTLMGESSLMTGKAKLLAVAREDSGRLTLNGWRVPPSTLAKEGHMTTAPDLPGLLPGPGVLHGVPTAPAPRRPERAAAPPRAPAPPPPRPGAAGAPGPPRRAPPPPRRARGAAAAAGRGPRTARAGRAGRGRDGGPPKGAEQHRVSKRE